MLLRAATGGVARLRERPPLFVAGLVLAIEYGPARVAYSYLQVWRCLQTDSVRVSRVGPKPYTALITGATSGLGLAIARQLLRADGNVRLILIGRLPIETAQLADPVLFARAKYCRVDLSTRDGCATQIGAFLEAEKVLHLDLVIHCAGMGFVGNWEREPPEHMAAHFATNVEAPICITRRVAGLLTDTARIVFISSVASAVPSPDYAHYAATKAAIDSFASNLRLESEYDRKGRIVLSIRMGPIATNFHSKVGFAVTPAQQRRFTDVNVAASRVLRIIFSRPRASGTGRASATFHTDSCSWAVSAMCSAVPEIARLAVSTWTPKRPGLGGPESQGYSVKRALLTGASSGIGLSLLRLLKTKGYAVTMIDCAIPPDALADGDAFLQCDIADAEQLLGLRDALGEREPFSLVIHNAGVNFAKPFEIASERELVQMLRVNALAPALLSSFLAREGLVLSNSTSVFVSSLSYFSGYPGSSAYAASKDFLAAWSASLGTCINTLTVFPGPTRTAQAAANSPIESEAAAQRRACPTAVAAEIMHAVEAGWTQVIPSGTARLIACLSWVWPSIVEKAMQHSLYAQLLKKHGRN